jgi:hypothetical protein
MTYVTKEPQRPGVMSILSDVKEGKVTRTILHRKRPVSKPRTTWKASSNYRFGKYLFLQCEKEEGVIL